jgi:hypothetical protein
MAPTPAQPLVYGPSKYAAFHLLLARMFRHYSAPGEAYQYVTLGGTELRDVRSIEFIDRRILEGALSFEDNDERFALAQATARRFQEAGLSIEVVHESLFDGFQRALAEHRHLFFVDFEGRCAFSDYHRQFGRMFRKQFIRENDILLITSFLGGRKKWERIEEEYDPEFRILGIHSSTDKQDTFRVCHPSFTLRRALREANMQDELAVECFGFVAYKDPDRSPMGICGYVIRQGRTDLRTFLRVPQFEIRRTPTRRKAK